MARRNGFWDVLKDLDRNAASLAYIGPIMAAENIVKDLQERGPAWTGKFSNSWQIVGPQNQTAKGTGQAGKPTPVKFQQGPFTGRQALRTAGRTTFTTNKVIFTISNFSRYAEQAMDLMPYDPDKPTTKNLNPIIETGTRPPGGRRGDLQGVGGNRITAPLDWYSTYVGGGYIDKVIRVTMSGILRSL